MKTITALLFFLSLIVFAKNDMIYSDHVEYFREALRYLKLIIKSHMKYNYSYFNLEINIVI
jgi:hypothetical protein